MAQFAPSGPAPLSTVAVQGSTAPTIANVDMTNANTEYSYFLPAGTKQFVLKMRTANKLQLAYISSGSNINYITVPMGVYWGRSNLTLATGLTLYFQSPAANQVLEIESWQ